MENRRNKEKLINYLKSFDLFILNEYFYKYVDIICDRPIEYKKYATHKHHIIPKYYFRRNKLKIDSSSGNIVVLYASDHVLCHYYLIYCLRYKEDIWASAHAFLQLTNEYLIPEEQEVIRKLPEYQHIFEYWSKKQGENRKRHGGTTTGRKCIYNKKLNIKKYVNSEEVDAYISNGWIIGGLPSTEQSNKKRSLNHRGRVYYTNGKIDIALKPGSPIPEGFRKGRCDEFTKKRQGKWDSFSEEKKREINLKRKKTWEKTMQMRHKHKEV